MTRIVYSCSLLIILMVLEINTIFAQRRQQIILKDNAGERNWAG